VAGNRTQALNVASPGLYHSAIPIVLLSLSTLPVLQIQTAITELQAESNIKVAVLELSAIRERFAHIFKFWPHAK